MLQVLGFLSYLVHHLCPNWIIHRHHQPLTFCISLVTQETQTQLLLCPGGVEWSEAASSCGALWGWIPAALCPREGGDCQDTQPWPGANQGAFPGHPQTGAKWPKGRNTCAHIDANMDVLYAEMYNKLTDGAWYIVCYFGGSIGSNIIEA